MSRIEDVVERVVADVVDPCSVAAGAPMNLVEMGMLRGVTVCGRQVTVHLSLTTPGCLYGPLFAAEVEQHVGAEIGTDWHVVARVDVDADWDEAKLAPSARARLSQARELRGEGRPPIT